MSLTFEYRIRSIQLEDEIGEKRIQMVEDRDRQLEDYLSNSLTKVGITTVTTDATGAFTITFPVAYASGTVPVVSAQVKEPNAAIGYYIILVSSDSVSFTGRVWSMGSVVAGTTTFDVHWISVGIPA